MRTAFFGTPEWAVPSLDALLDSEAEVAAVVTNPDRPAGRGMEPRPPPVKRRAEQAGIDVLQPAKARDPALKERIQAIDPEACVVVAYGSILPKDLLEVPPLGFVNVHFSLLPEYRGAAPVQRAIMDGRNETGVSIMVLTEGMDEGPVLAVEAMPIRSDDSAGTLGERMARAGAELLVPTLRDYGQGRLRPQEQDHDRATYAPKIAPEEARIDWTRPADAIHNHVRALNPVPGAWTTLSDRRLKVWGLEVLGLDEERGPGVVGRDPRLVVGTGKGAVRLTDVQLAGRKRMTGEELLRGLRLGAGTVLG